MKIIGIILFILVLLAAIFQIYMSWSVSDIEQHRYTVIKNENGIEIRKYEPAVFASVQKQGKMFDSQNQSFRELAGYIFGGNEAEKSIAMTAPVQMQDQNDTAQMSFMIPAEYELSSLPKPKNENIQFTEQPGYFAAVIQYGGFNNPEKFKQHSNRLEQYIQEHDPKPKGSFIFLGYNPPFQWFGRRNEVMIKIVAPPDS